MDSSLFCGLRISINCIKFDDDCRPSRPTSWRIGDRIQAGRLELTRLPYISPHSDKIPRTIVDAGLGSDVSIIFQDPTNLQKIFLK